MKVNVPIDIPQKRIKDIIITAMEQGSGYWTQVTNQSKWPEGAEDRYDLPLLGGWIEFGILDDTKPGYAFTAQRHRLGRNNIRRGIKIMAEKYPRHFADFMSESGDAETADVFLQCCLLGEIVYG